MSPSVDWVVVTDVSGQSIFASSGVKQFKKNLDLRSTGLLLG